MAHPRAIPLAISSLLLFIVNVPGFGQDVQGQLHLTIPDSLRRSLTVESQPAGAELWLNGVKVGTTPYSSAEIEYGSCAILLEKPGYSSFRDTVIIQFGSHPKISARLRKPGSLEVESAPRGAQVFCDGEFLGLSPLKKGDLRAGTHTLELYVERYEWWRRQIVVPEDSVLFVSAELAQERGLLNVNVTQQDALIEVDNVEEGKGTLRDFSLTPGEHVVRITHPPSGMTARQTLSVTPGMKLAVEANLMDRTWSPVLWSALAPGLGQLVSGSTTEGIVLLSGTAVLGGWALSSAIAYSSSLSSYNDARARYLGETSDEYLLLQYRKEMQWSYDTANQKSKLRNISLAAFGTLYLYSLIEAYLNHSHVAVVSVTPLTDEGPLGHVAPSGALSVTVSLRF